MSSAKAIKITKVLMVDAISDHLENQGKKLTNLNRISKEKLEFIIKAEKIDINAFYQKQQKEFAEQDRITTEVKERHRQDLLKIIEKETNLNNNINNLIDLFDPVVKNMCIYKISLNCEFNEVEKWKTLEPLYMRMNHNLVADTEQQYLNYKEQGDNVQRGTTKNTIVLNGAIVRIGEFIKRLTKEQYYEQGIWIITHKTEYKEKLLKNSVLDRLAGIHVKKTKLKPKKKLKLKIVDRL